jgi:hypothetical protein
MADCFIPPPPVPGCRLASACLVRACGPRTRRTAHGPACAAQHARAAPAWPRIARRAVLPRARAAPLRQPQPWRAPPRPAPRPLH